MTPRVGTLVCFWDYDTQWGADRSRSGGGPKQWGHLDFEYTEQLLEIHEQFGIPACFAVVGAAALAGSRPYHDPAQIRRIHRAGHEVASHSFHHDWLPGVGYAGLRETLRASKAALEDCIGERVSAFVPPFNQPFDHPQGLSFSRSERRLVKHERIDLGRLCDSLKQTGYEFCRVSYRPILVRLAEHILGRAVNRPVEIEQISGIACLRTNTPGGFDGPALDVLRRCAETGGIATVYGHPHSLHPPNPQGREALTVFLRTAAELRRLGKLRVATPSSLLRNEVAELAARDMV
jgi:peptidoglycan/xylan/chitin deacetylase (PgdA/CDA1 family)